MVRQLQGHQPHPEPSEVEPQEELPESNDPPELLPLSNDDGLGLGEESNVGEWLALWCAPASCVTPPGWWMW